MTPPPLFEDICVGQKIKRPLIIVENKSNSMINIHKSTKAKTLGKFYVTISGKNGQILNVSEMLNTKANCIKNIKAVAGVFRIDRTEPIKVLDCTGKKEKEIVL